MGVHRQFELPHVDVDTEGALLSPEMIQQVFRWNNHASVSGSDIDPESPGMCPSSYHARCESRCSNMSGASVGGHDEDLLLEVRVFEKQRDRLLCLGYTNEEVAGHVRWLAETQLPTLGPLLLRDA